MNAFNISPHTAADEELLGKALGYPIGTQENYCTEDSVFVGSFSNMAAIFETRATRCAAVPSVFTQGSLDPAFRYRLPVLTETGIHYGEQAYTIENYLQRQRITSLLILKDNEILFERYQYDRQPTQRFMSFSMAKSITGLAVGLALEEGKIQSLDDKIGRYLPEMAAYAYGDTSIRNILRMASGVKFSEIYDGADDLRRLLSVSQEKGIAAALKMFNQREAPEGKRFNYATSETCVLGLLLAKVTGATLSDYVAEKIWQPMGAETDALWMIDRDGMEYSGSGFAATLRDYGRLGMLLANDGMRDGVQLLPKPYLLEATDWRRHPLAFHPRQATPVFGYGYQFWLFPGEQRRFALVGVRGQAIYVDTASKLVLVQTAAAKEADFYTHGSLGQELAGVWLSLLKMFGAL